MMLVPVVLFLGTGLMLVITAIRWGVNLGLEAVRDRRHVNRRHDQIGRESAQRKPPARPMEAKIQ